MTLKLSCRENGSIENLVVNKGMELTNCIMLTHDVGKKKETWYLSFDTVELMREWSEQLEQLHSELIWTCERCRPPHPPRTGWAEVPPRECVHAIGSLPGRFHRQLLEKDGRGISKSQSKRAAYTMEHPPLTECLHLQVTRAPESSLRLLPLP